jgi:hypothetical protein
MKAVIGIAMVLGLAAAADAAASEIKPLTLQLKPKAALASTTPSSTYAPFLLSASTDPELDLLPRRDLRDGESRSSCNKQQAICYDAAAGRIEFRPARNLMPDIPGLQRETISVKRDRIILKYSF